MVTGCAVIVVLLHLLFAFWQIPSGWGVHFLAFFPAWVAFGSTALALLLLLPAVSDRAVRMVSGLRTHEVHLPILRHRRVRYALTSLPFLIPFYLLRTRVLTLGDGPSRVQQLAQHSTGLYHEPLTSYLVRILYEQIHGSGEADAFQVYRILSWTCGVIYVFFALLAADEIGRNRQERTILRLFLLTIGTIELFCGYAENYAPLTAFILLYLYTSWRYLDVQGSLTTPALVWSIAFAFHFSAAVLFPSLAFLYYTEWQRDLSKRSFYLKLVLPPALVLSILLFVGFDLRDFFQKLGTESHTVPLWTPDPLLRPHALLSSVHLLDVVNQHLLVAPMGLLLIGAVLLTMRTHIVLNPPLILLSSGVFFYVLLTAIFNTEIGAFRDWDVLSPVAVPTVLLAAYLLTRCVKSTAQIRLAWMVSVVSLFHLVPWLYVNADTDRSIARFAASLSDASRLSARVRAWGYEELCVIHERMGRKREALEAARAALDAQPRRSWLLTKVFRLMEAVEGPEKIELFLKDAIARDPGFDFSRFRLGYLYYQKGDLDGAIKEFRQTVRINPNFVEAHNNLGAALERKGDLDGAIREYHQAIRIDPEFLDAYYNLGSALEQKRDLDGAVGAYRQVVRINPRFVNAYYNLGIILANRGDSVGAIQEFRNYIRLSADGHWKQAAQDSIRRLGGTP